MHRPDPRTSQHRLKCFGDHRHIDDHAVAFAHAIRLQHTCDGGDAGLQLGKSNLGLGAGDRAVVDNRHLIGAAVFDVPVHGVVTRIYLGIREPFVQIITFFEQRLTRSLLPVDGFGLL